MALAGQLDRASSQPQIHKLTGIEHFAMPTKSMVILERFVREILGGIPYYYAGYDEVDRKMGRKPHIFMRVGEVLFQCTEEGGPMHPDKDDNSVSPHWAFGIESGRLNGFMKVLRDNAIPFAGPYLQPQFGVTSIYFKSPEAHKLEVCSPGSDPGAKGVAESQIDWMALNHNWKPKASSDLKNINPVLGGRFSENDSSLGLTCMHHFTLPANDPVLMEGFSSTFLVLTTGTVREARCALAIPVSSVRVTSIRRSIRCRATTISRRIGASVPTPQRWTITLPR